MERTLILIRCQCCGSQDLLREGSFFRCEACGARFVLSQEQKDIKKKIVKHRDKMIDAMLKNNDEKRDRQIEKILELDPEDPYAWTGIIGKYIGLGIANNAERCIDAACKAMACAKKYGTEEEIEDIREFFRGNIGGYENRLIEYAPERKDDIERLVSWGRYGDEDFEAWS